ncbi:MAG TPA: hypothetical protein PLN52_22900, partial [Opitutaceae bacterium]|nr:hypothetical protein [Opitutaceae bacterium]
MNCRFLPALVSLASLFASAVLLAQPQTPANQAPAKVEVPVAELSLEECVARALSRNFDLEIQRITTDQAKENVIIAEA